MLLYLARDAASALLKPLRPSGINTMGPSQQIAAKKALKTELMLASFSFTLITSNKLVNALILDRYCDMISTNDNKNAKFSILLGEFLLEERIIRDLFLGFMKVHLLHHAAEGAIYGTQMITELGRHGYNIGPGTLYPILHNMKKQGLLRSQEVVVEGKVRKYYHITEAGRQTLAAATRQALELVREIVPEGGEKA